MIGDPAARKKYDLMLSLTMYDNRLYRLACTILRSQLDEATKNSVIREFKDVTHKREELIKTLKNMGADEDLFRHVTPHEITVVNAILRGEYKNGKETEPPTKSK